MSRHTLDHMTGQATRQTMARKTADGRAEENCRAEQARGTTAIHNTSQQHSPIDNKRLDYPSDLCALRKIAQSRPEHFARLADKLRNKEIHQAPVAVRARLRGLLFQREMRRQCDHSAQQRNAGFHRENDSSLTLLRQKGRPAGTQSNMQSALRRVQQLRSDLRALQCETHRLTAVEPTQKQMTTTAKIFPLRTDK